MEGQRARLVAIVQQSVQPVGQQSPEQPSHHGGQPRYYDARRSRRGFVVALVVVLLVAAATVLILRSDLVASETPEVRGATVGLADLDTPPGETDADVEDVGSIGDYGFDSVGMVGDSITAGSLEELKFVLAAHGVEDATIDGVPSRRIELGNGKSEPLNGVGTLYGLLAAGLEPDAWVIALGTNDVGQYGDEADYARLVDTIVEMLPDDVPLVWVDVYRPAYLEDTETFNRIVRDRLEERGNAAVASWFDVASRPDQHVLQDDRIHPNENGRAAFAGLVSAALATLA